MTSSFLYYGGNVVFKTTDGGRNWSIISPDLTTDDKEKQKSSGGPITPDNTRAEVYCTIVSIAESPRDPKVIWAGTDDGNVQITRDGGAHWTNVARNIPGRLPAPWVKSIHASRKDAGTAYLAIDQHWQDNFRPHAFMTTDYGQTWKDISAGRPSPRSSRSASTTNESATLRPNWTPSGKAIWPSSIRDCRPPASPQSGSTDRPALIFSGPISRIARVLRSKLDCNGSPEKRIELRASCVFGPRITCRARHGEGVLWHVLQFWPLRPAHPLNGGIQLSGSSWPFLPGH